MKWKLPTRKEAIAWISEPENQARLLIYGSWVVLGMTIMGYVMMAFYIFK